MVLYSCSMNCPKMNGCTSPVTRPASISMAAWDALALPTPNIPRTADTPRPVIFQPARTPTDYLHRTLKCGDRIQRRASTSADRKRGRREKELPTSARCGGIAECFQIAVVQNGRTHRDQQQLMYRLRDAGDARRHNIRGGVTAHDRHIPRSQPAHARRI